MLTVQGNLKKTKSVAKNKNLIQCLNVVVVVSMCFFFFFFWGGGGGERRRGN